MSTVQPALLHVKIITPKVDLFDGDAKSVSSVNSAGSFDILPKHANFITMIENSPITIHKADGTRVIYNFTLAIIYTTNDRISIYTDLHLKLPSSTPTQQPLANK